MTRHRWGKLEVHRYVCLTCGLLKVNQETAPGHWVAVFHLPSGFQRIARHVPRCEVGPFTAQRLALFHERQARSQETRA